MKHSIKLSRAKRNAGFLTEATNHILGSIPESAIKKLSGAEIAELMQAMNAHYWQGRKAAEKEIEEYIGLPNGIRLWDVIGDHHHSSGYTFSDGLHIPDVLEKRGEELYK